MLTCEECGGTGEVDCPAECENEVDYGGTATGDDPCDECNGTRGVECPECCGDG